MVEFPGALLPPMAVLPVWPMSASLHPSGTVWDVSSLLFSRHLSLGVVSPKGGHGGRLTEAHGDLDGRAAAWLMGFSTTQLAQCVILRPKHWP